MTTRRIFLASLLSAVLFCAVPAHAQIAYDTSVDGSFSGSPLTWSHTTTGSNRILFALFSAQSGDVLTGATYNGVAMTLIGKRLSTVNGNEVYLYCLENPASGAHTISATASAGNIIGLSSSYTGANQSCAVDSSATGFAAGGSASLTLTTTVVGANAWLVGVWSASGGTLSAGTGTTLRQNPATQAAIGDSNGIVGTGSQSLQATQASSEFAGVIASIIPAGGGGGSTPRGMLLGVGP